MEHLGIVKGVGFGMRDCSTPILWFTVDTLDGGSLQVFNLERAGEMIKEANVYDVKNLEGKPCVVEMDRGLMTFIRWHK